MNDAIKILLDTYRIISDEDYEYALREITQYIALLGLWRSKFFEYAAFYGGTALRLFYGLQRYSEDIDFSLIHPDSGFALDPFLKAIEKELEGFGFQMKVISKTKRTNIKSAFIKGNTIKNLLVLKARESILTKLPENKTLKVRFELDIDPPGNASCEVKTLLIPFPFHVRLFTLPDLFASKIHAVLCRKWKQRIKGRDYYDMLWYIGRGVECNIQHLQARMEQTGDWQGNHPLTGKDIRKKLYDRFAEINVDLAKRNILPFINDPAEVSLWSKDFFIQRIPEIRFFRGLIDVSC